MQNLLSLNAAKQQKIPHTQCLNLGGDYRVASRQTYAFLAAIGLSDFSAHNTEDYIARAVYWASYFKRLSLVRAGLRQNMVASGLMNTESFIAEYGQLLIKLVSNKLKRSPDSPKDI